MAFSRDELPTAGEWPRPTYSVRIEWAYCWVGMLPWEVYCFWTVLDSLGSEKMTQLTKIPGSPNPSSRRLASRRHTAQRNRRGNCSFVYPHRRNSLITVPEVSKLPKKGELVVFNPLTGETRTLPPLLYPRNPVLVRILADSAKRSYKVIVAGSCAAGDEHLSREVEVFDSSTSKWKEVCDLLGPAFGLNEHQAGVFLNGKLFLISLLESGGRGVVAFDVESGTWLQDLATPIPWSSFSNTVQLVESDGKLFVVSEQQRDQSVDHCIVELEFPNPKAGLLTCRWRSFVKVKKSGGRGLQVYPEHTCVGFGEEKLDILSKKLLYFLSSCIAIMPNGACAADQRMDSLSGMWTSNAWGSHDFAKKAAMTLLLGLTMIGARVAWGIFRRLQTPGNRLDIMQGLEDSDIPTRGNPVFEILPDILEEVKPQTKAIKFDIMQGLEDSDIPTRRNPLFAILPDYFMKSFH